LHQVKRNSDSKALSEFRFTRPEAGRVEWNEMEWNGFGASPPQTKKRQNASNTIIRFQLAAFKALQGQESQKHPSREAASPRRKASTIPKKILIISLCENIVLSLCPEKFV